MRFRTFMSSMVSWLDRRLFLYTDNGKAYSPSAGTEESQIPSRSELGCRPVQMISGKLYSQKSEYDQEIPKSHTADQPTAPRGKATEH